MLALLLALTLTAPPRPTSATLRKAFERNREALVEVRGPHHRGIGVLVGAQGQVLTLTAYVGLEEATVQLEGEALPAKVLWADAKVRLALLQLTTPRPCHASAVRATDRFEPGEWLVGITRDSAGSPSPRLGRVLRGPTGKNAFIETDLMISQGSPVFDDQGRLLALSIGRSRAMPVVHVKRALLSLGRDEGAP